MCRRTKCGWRSHSRGAERCHTGVLRQGWMARPSVTVRRAVDWGSVRVLEGEGRGASAAVGNNRGARGGGRRRGLEAVSVSVCNRRMGCTWREDGKVKYIGTPEWAGARVLLGSRRSAGSACVGVSSGTTTVCAWSLISPSPMPAPRLSPLLTHMSSSSVCASGASLLTAAHCQDLAKDKLDKPASSSLLPPRSSPFSPTPHASHSLRHTTIAAKAQDAGQLGICRNALTRRVNDVVQT